MTLLFFIGTLLILVPLLGRYITWLFSGKPLGVLNTIENCFYKIANIDPTVEMNWKTYGLALLQFNLIGFAVLFLILLFQDSLPFNPQNFPGLPLDLAFNTTVSFVTNTNWQAYAGETTLSYFSQMVGLTTQNFLSPATGMAVMLVFIRGLMRTQTTYLGNFWSDLVRTILFLLLPLATILACLLVLGGVVQSMSPYEQVTTLENATQIIPLGPVASQEAIKMVGTNGGGFFNANSAHPFENPSAWTNFLETLAIVLIPAASIYAYGLMIGSRKHPFLLVMLVLWIAGFLIAYYAEQVPNPDLASFPNWEGKETRFGIANSLIWTVSTTDTANGAVNNMHSSLSPLTGGIALLNMMLGELILGGVGVGLCSMLMFVLLTVFLCGLMVGRTPEYLGKKISKDKIKWVSIGILKPGVLVLIGTGTTTILPYAISSVVNPGPHGLTEILYAFTSAGVNNGSAFAGMNVNTPYFNWMLGIIMILGRIAILLPSLAVANLLAQKIKTPTSAGTFSVDTYLFAILLILIILIVGALTFFPSLALGPIVEQFLMLEGRVF